MTLEKDKIFLCSERVGCNYCWVGSPFTAVLWSERFGKRRCDGKTDDCIHRHRLFFKFTTKESRISFISTPSCSPSTLNDFSSFLISESP